MKSKWKVTSNYINGNYEYAVYRLLDKKQLDHSGNREYFSNYVSDRKMAEKMAEKLNEIQVEISERALELIKKFFHPEEWDTPDEKWYPEREFYAIVKKVVEEFVLEVQ